MSKGITKYRKIFCIPDIHGRSDLLLDALDLIEDQGYNDNLDAVVFLGDMIDRGPDSKGVLDTIIRFQKGHKNVIVLRGNHEDFAVDYYVKKLIHSRDAWYMNGGRQTEWSYPDVRMTEEHIKFLASLPYHYQDDGFHFSHAPVPREKHRYGKVDGVLEYTVNELTWTYMGSECDRKGALFDQHEGPRSDNGTGDRNLIGVCGHIHRGRDVTSIREFPKYRMLDCGAGCWDEAPLAIHECHSGETWYVKKVNEGKKL